MSAEITDMAGMVCPDAAMLNKKHNNIHKYALFFHLCING
jgi:hypothetical protein